MKTTVPPACSSTWGKLLTSLQFVSCDQHYVQLEHSRKPYKWQEPWNRIPPTITKNTQVKHTESRFKQLSLRVLQQLQGGAQFTASNVTITKTALVGVEVRDQGSAATLSDCTLKEFPPLYNETFAVRAVHAHAGSKVTLTSTTVSGGVFGVDARVAAEATLTDCNIRNPVQACVVIRNGACGWLEGCLLGRTLQCDLPMSYGLYVDGPGSETHANKTRFVGHAQSGAFVHETAKLTAHACISSGNHVSGFVVHSKGRMELKDCRSERDGKGCLVEEGGSLAAVNVTVARSEGEAFAIGEEGQAQLVGCSGTNCGEEGVQVAHEGTVVLLEMCTFSQNEFDNVVVRQGATAILNECTLSQSATKSGVAAEGELTNVSMRGCTLSRNAQCGVLADQGAKVTAHVCMSKKNKREGYTVTGGARMDVRDSTSEDDAVGCRVGGGRKMLLQAVVVDGVPTTGTLLAGEPCAQNELYLPGSSIEL